MNKRERLLDIINRHVYQRANEIYCDVLSQDYGEAFTDCWSNMFYDDEELLNLGYEENQLEEARDNGEDYKEIYEYCKNYLKKQEVIDEVKEILRPFVTLLFQEFYPYIYISILLVIVSFFLLLGIFFVLMRNKYFHCK